MSDGTGSGVASVVDTGDRFEARTADGALAAYAAYQRQGDAVVFTHTKVEPAFEGKGVGSALVASALDQVRQSGQRVVAQCPFVEGYVQRHPQYQDLLQRS